MRVWVVASSLSHQRHQAGQLVDVRALLRKNIILDIEVIPSKQDGTYQLDSVMLGAALSLDLVVGASHSLYTLSHSLYNFHISAGHDHILLFVFGTLHRPNPAAAGY